MWSHVKNEGEDTGELQVIVMYVVEYACQNTPPLTYGAKKILYRDSVRCP